MRCRDQVRDAVRQSDTAWPPQAAEFAILCEPLPSDYGLPNEHDAWSEANAAAHAPDRHQWSHVAVRIAANAVPGGFREIHGCTSQSRRASLKKQFVRQYLALVNRVMAGESLQAQMLIESDASKTPASLAERASRERAQRAAAPFEQFN
ncbi:replication protein P, partial [Carnimonas bestiolae]|uniref:replication protein P n=1 Tax=Carnimonas bestiolae TaxID=3402172 RepID=UPI003F4AA5E7